MIKLKEIQVEGLYVFYGKASANSNFIESKLEAKEFIHSANRRFSNFLKIREYLVTQDSWFLVCEVEDRETIINEYLKKRKTSQKDHRRPSLTAVWRIVSEQFRHFLSLFVKFCNFRRGRTGRLVHSSYERAFFESEEEAQIFIKGLCNQTQSISQKNVKYRPKAKYFEFGKYERKGHVYLCSLNLRSMLGVILEVGKSMVAWDLASHVLRKLVKSTLNLHSHQKTNIFSPKKE